MRMRNKAAIILLLLIFSLLFLFGCQKQKVVAETEESPESQSGVLEIPSKWYYFRKSGDKWIRRSRVEFHVDGVLLEYTQTGSTNRNKWELDDDGNINLEMGKGIFLTGKLINDNLIKGARSMKPAAMFFEMRKVDEFEHNDGTVPYTYTETELQGIKSLKEFFSGLTVEFGTKKILNGENKDLELFVKNNGKPEKIEITDGEYLDQNRPKKYKKYKLYYKNFFYEFRYDKNYLEYKKGGRKFDYSTDLFNVRTTEDAVFDNGVYIGMPEAEFWHIFGLDTNMPKLSPYLSVREDKNKQTKNYMILSNYDGVWACFNNDKLAYVQWNEEGESFRRDPSLPEPKRLLRYVPLPNDGSWSGDTFITDQSTLFDEIIAYEGESIPDNEIVFDKSLPESDTAVIYWGYRNTGTVRPIAYNGNKVDWKISRNRRTSIRIPAGKTIFEFKGQTGTGEAPPLGVVWNWDGFSFSYNFEKGKEYGITIEGTELVIYKDGILKEDLSLAHFEKPDNEPYPLMWLLSSEEKQ